MKINKFLQKSPLIPLLISSRFIEAELSKELAAKNLSWQGASILTALFFEERACGLRELGKHLALPSSRLSQLINTLEADGLITRQLKAGNSRSKYLTLTAAGKKVCIKVIAIFDSATEKLETRLGRKDSEHLAELLLAVYRTI